MLGKIHPLILGPVGIVLVLGIVIAGFMFMVKPKQQQIASVQDQITQEKTEADKKQQAEKALDDVKRDWESAHDGLAQKMDERSIPLSMGHPMIATMNLWREAREDLPQLVEKFVAQSGCVLVRGHGGWAPPMSPLPTSTEWIHFAVGTGSAGGAEINAVGDQPLVVAGTMGDIERLYKSLRNFPRVLTIRHLALMPLREMAGTQMHATVQQILDKPEDDVMVGLLYMDIWLMCEAAEGGGGAAAAGGGGMGGGMPGGGMGGGAPGGMSGPPGGMSGPPGGSAGSGPPSPPSGGGSGDKAGGKAGKGDE